MCSITDGEYVFRVDSAQASLSLGMSEGVDTRLLLLFSYLSFLKGWRDVCFILLSPLSLLSFPLSHLKGQSRHSFSDLLVLSLLPVFPLFFCSSTLVKWLSRHQLSSLILSFPPLLSSLLSCIFPSLPPLPIFFALFLSFTPPLWFSALLLSPLLSPPLSLSSLSFLHLYLRNGLL